MKITGIFLTTLLTAPFVYIAPAQAQTKTQTQTQAQTDTPFRFAVTEWSFGDIREEAGPVSHIFEFTNTGKTPLAIDRVVTSCGCTTPDYPKTPIAPGSGARLKVTFDPRGYPGEFSKSIIVMSGGSKFRNVLMITGHVIPRPKTVAEEYPHDMGSGLRVSTDILTFRTLAQGHSAAMVVDAINTSSTPLALTWEQVEGSGMMKVHGPGTLCAGCRGNITFTYDLSEESVYGQIHDTVRPVVDGKPSDKTIYTAMTGIDDFTGVDAALAPRFFLDASFHDFGEVRRRAIPYIFRLTASNESAGVLHIRSVSTSEGLQSTLRGGMTIAPGATLPFEVIFYTGKYLAGRVGASIQMVVDDPVRPTREIRISAIII